jgi:hypothetical protein
MGGHTGRRVGGSLRRTLLAVGIATGVALLAGVSPAGATQPGPGPGGGITATGSLPGAPLLLGVTATGPGTVAVSFTAPVDGAAPASYRAVCTSTTGGTTRNATRSASPVRVGNLTPGHTYSCSVAARNRTGTGPASSASTPVVVPTVPGAPAAVTVRLDGARRVSVAFAAPATDGGAPVSRYWASCTNTLDATTRSRTGSASPIVVGTFATGASYTCVVRALNLAGAGPASLPSAVITTPVPPAAPGAVAAVPTDGDLLVSFRPPPSDGGAPVTTYRTRCVSPNGGVARIADATQSPVRLRSMTRGATYSCTVAATNVAGAGPSSTSSAPVIAGCVAPRTTAPEAQQFWVTQTGDDANPGTGPDAPLRTIERALSLVGPGDSIEIGAGTWPSLGVVGISGTEAAPIVLRAAPGAEGAVWFSTGNRLVNAGLVVDGSCSLVLEDLNVRDSLWGLRILGSRDITYRSSEIVDLGQEAITVQRGSRDVLIEGNLITRTGLERPRFGEAIYLGSGDDGVHDPTRGVVIRDNELAWITAEAIDVKPRVSDVRIEGNLIHDVATANSGAVVVGIGDLVYDDPGVLIRGNRIWNISTTSPWSDGNAITLSAPATVVNNVIWNVQHRGILADGDFGNPDARTVRIHHNTVWNWGLVAIEAWVTGNPADADIRNNIGPDLPGNVAATAELFVDAAAGDFRLRPTAAAAIGTAAPIDGVTTDIEGTPRGATPDMGAYQSVPEASTTP